jgi:hypothetical protein
MTLRQYAAIKLKVPDSGTDWLDDMIRESLRDDFAAKAMQSLIEKVVLRDQATGMPQPVVTEVQEKIARGAYAYADAMLKAKQA